MKKYIKKILPRLGYTIFNHVCYYYLHIKNKKIPPRISIKNPLRFNEKIIWLKKHYRHPNASIYADKVAVKDFVAKKLGVI